MKHEEVLGLLDYLVTYVFNKDKTITLDELHDELKKRYSRYESIGSLKRDLEDLNLIAVIDFRCSVISQVNPL